MEFLHRGVVGLAPGIDDDGPLRAQLIEMQAHGFPDAPLDPVAHHGFAERTRDGESDLRSAGFGFAYTKRGKQGTGKARSVIVNPPKILGTQYADTFRKTRDGNYLSSLTVSFLRPCARRRERTARPFFVSMRERNPCVLAR